MDLEAFARGLARLLKAHEPTKVRGGSPERRAWLKTVLVIQMAAMELGQEEVFKQELLDE